MENKNMDREKNKAIKRLRRIVAIAAAGIFTAGGVAAAITSCKNGNEKDYYTAELKGDSINLYNGDNTEPYAKIDASKLENCTIITDFDENENSGLIDIVIVSDEYDIVSVEVEKKELVKSEKIDISGELSPEISYVAVPETIVYEDSNAEVTKDTLDGSTYVVISGEEIILDDGNDKLTEVIYYDEEGNIQLGYVNSDDILSKDVFYKTYKELEDDEIQCFIVINDGLKIENIKNGNITDSKSISKNTTVIVAKNTKDTVNVSESKRYVTYMDGNENIVSGWISDYASNLETPENYLFRNFKSGNYEVYSEGEVSGYVGIDISSGSIWAEHFDDSIMDGSIELKADEGGKTIGDISIVSDDSTEQSVKPNFVYIRIGRTDEEKEELTLSNMDDELDFVKSIIKTCEQNQIPYGFYYYSQALPDENNTDLNDEVGYISNFLEELQNDEECSLNYNIMPLALDFEDPSEGHRHYNYKQEYLNENSEDSFKEEYTDFVNEELNAISEECDVDVILYTDQNMLEEYINVDDIEAKLWLVDCGPAHSDYANNLNSEKIVCRQIVQNAVVSEIDNPSNIDVNIFDKEVFEELFLEKEIEKAEETPEAEEIPEAEETPEAEEIPETEETPVEEETNALEDSKITIQAIKNAIAEQNKNKER